MAKKAVKKAVGRRRRDRKVVDRGQAHIKSTFNNTIIHISIISNHFIINIYK